MCLSSTRKSSSRDHIKMLLGVKTKLKFKERKRIWANYRMKFPPFSPPEYYHNLCFAVVSVTIAAEWVKHIGGGCSRSRSWSSSVVSCCDARAGAATLVSSVQSLSGHFCAVLDSLAEHEYCEGWWCFLQQWLFVKRTAITKQDRKP